MRIDYRLEKSETLLHKVRLGAKGGTTMKNIMKAEQQLQQLIDRADECIDRHCREECMVVDEDTWDDCSMQSLKNSIKEIEGGKTKSGDPPKNYEVKLYYSTYCTHLVQAENEEEAIAEASKIEIDGNSEVISEIVTNLDAMDDVGVEEVSYG
jgi:hypothetical protein